MPKIIAALLIILPLLLATACLTAKPAAASYQFDGRNNSQFNVHPAGDAGAAAGGLRLFRLTRTDNSDFAPGSYRYTYNLSITLSQYSGNADTQLKPYILERNKINGKDRKKLYQPDFSDFKNETANPKQVTLSRSDTINLSAGQKVIELSLAYTCNNSQQITIRPSDAHFTIRES